MQALKQTQTLLSKHPPAENPLLKPSLPQNPMLIRSASLLPKQTLLLPSNPPKAENPAAKPIRMLMPTSAPVH